MNDEQIKRVFGENSDLIKAFSRINAIQFQYNNKARELDPAGVGGVDNDLHVGVKAQELLQNPVTSSTVKEGPEGFLQIDTKELTTANTAVLSEVCKRLDVLEQTVNELRGVIYGN